MDQLYYIFVYDLETGKIITPYYGLADKLNNIPEGCGETSAIPFSSANNDVADAYSNPTLYVVVDGEIVKVDNYDDTLLSNAKSQKIDEINKTCNTTILSNFTSTAYNGEEHVYASDYEAQSNFANAKNAFDLNPNLTSIKWTTKDAGQLEHTKEQFVQLYLEGFTRIQGLIDKYHTLKSQVDGCATIDEVNAIIWE